jgi:Transposase DDE domain/Transposase domain (DUF772)
MALDRWYPAQTLTGQEQMLLRRLGRVRKLLGFLRLHRRELIDDAFQVALEGMYRRTGAGRPPVPPGMMAMAMLVQGYLGVSDAELVELTVVDLRVQMVLGRLGETKPAFAQGTFHDFRARMIRADLDQKLLAKTVELARSTKAFDFKRLPKSLRVAVDSSPLEGAGRVEDTINLLAHAARKVVESAAHVLRWPVQRACAEAGISLLQYPSAKRALDIDWNDDALKADALRKLVAQLDSLQAWLAQVLPNECREPPLKDQLETLKQIREQDLEPDPEGGGSRIRRGVAQDRRISVEDSAMRHGRKSTARRFDGYKRHIAADLDRGLIVACTVTPANQPEHEALPQLHDELLAQGFTIQDLYIDRGYISSPIVDEVVASRGTIFCKPWQTQNGTLFAKSDFKLDLRARTITCPAGQTMPVRLGTTVMFDSATCDRCPLRQRCTDARPGTPRSVWINANEPLQQRLRKHIKSPSWREQLRERVAVEHHLAHISQRQGNRARYIGIRKNLFDLRRAASIQNLEVLHRGASTAHRKAA